MGQRGFGAAGVGRAWVEPLEQRMLLAADPVVSLVADINRFGSQPMQFLRAGGTVFFTADDGQHGRELWKTDGTSEGTALVKDLTPGAGGSNIMMLGAIGDRAVLGVQGSGWDSTVWVSDGTPAGTIILGQFGPLAYLAETMGNEVFFTESTPSTGNRLWKTDGTIAGTVLLTDRGASAPLHRAGDAIYFTRWGRELWVTDGTPEGTRLFVDLPLRPSNSEAAGPALSENGLIVYLDWQRLVSTDGTPDGTRTLLEHHAGRLVGFAQAGGLVFFRGTDFHSLWRTDGTPEGTFAVSHIAAGGPLVAVGGILFSIHGVMTGERALWMSDGTVSGTRKLVSLGLGSMVHIVDVNGIAYIATYDATFDGGHAEYLSIWRSDGTPDGTQRVAQVRGGAWPQSLYPEIVALPDGVLFVGDGFELYRLTNAPSASPVAHAGGPYVVDAGESVVLNASGSSDPDGDALVYQWDINGDGVFGDAEGVAPVLTAVRLRELGLLAGREYPVCVRVSDGGTVSFSAASLLRMVGVTGVRIEVAAKDAPGMAGLSIAYKAPADLPVTITVDWGNGQATGPLAAESGTAASLVIEHEYALPGRYPITVTFAAAHGVLAVEQVDFIREPVTPTVKLGVSALVAEDAPFPLIAELASPAGIALAALIIDWGDGRVQTVDGPEGVVRLSHAYADPGRYTIKTIVRDVDGREGALSLEIDVVERRPQPTIVGRTLARPGRTYVLRLRPDPLADRPIRYWTVNWGDGTIAHVPAGTAAVTHAYKRSGRFRIAVSATDAKGTFRAAPHGQVRSAALVLAVNNRIPRPTLAAPSSAVPGQPVRLAGKTNDGSSRGYTVAWDFGDRASEEPVFVPVTQASMNPERTYTAPGTYTVRMWVRNAAGEVAMARTTIEVAPIVIQTRPDRPGERALVVGGTDGNDNIRFVYRWSGVQLIMNGRSYGPFQVDRVIAFGGPGDDVIMVDDLVKVGVELYGGAGNDRLHASARERILVGGEGLDWITDGRTTWYE